MSIPAKINLSAIMKKNNDSEKNNDIKQETTEEEVTKIEEKDKPKIEEIKIEKKETLIENNKKNETINLEKKENTVKEDDTNNEHKEEVKEKWNYIKKEEIIKKWDMFWNYKSDFAHKEHKIIKKVTEQKKKLRERLNEPKTRILLVWWLITITAISISALFIIDPERHSLEVYKASIINNSQKIKTIYIDKPWVPETINIESYSFNIETQEKKGDNKNYKYNKIVYSSKDELYKSLNNEILIKKEEIIKKEKETKYLKEKEKEKMKKNVIKNVLIEKFK